MASHVELHTTEQEINHPNCLSLPGFTGPNVCHARERAKPIVRLNVIPKGATRDAAGDWRFDGRIEALWGFAIKGFRSADECVHRRRDIVFGIEKLHE
jgi:hypothetical protein